MKQKKFKIKSSILVKFKNTTAFTAQWTETEPTSHLTTTTGTSGVFNQ